MGAGYQISHAGGSAIFTPSQTPRQAYRPSLVGYQRCHDDTAWLDCVRTCRKVAYTLPSPDRAPSIYSTRSRKRQGLSWLWWEAPTRPKNEYWNLWLNFHSSNDGFSRNHIIGFILHQLSNFSTPAGPPHGYIVSRLADFIFPEPSMVFRWAASGNNIPGLLSILCLLYLMSRRPRPPPRCHEAGYLPYLSSRHRPAIFP